MLWIKQKSSLRICIDKYLHWFQRTRNWYSANTNMAKKCKYKHLKHPILIYFSWNIRSWSQFWIQTPSVLVADSLFRDLTQHCTMKKTLVHTLAVSLNRTETVHTLSRYKINLFQVLTGLLAWQSFSTILFQYRF